MANPAFWLAELYSQSIVDIPQVYSVYELIVYSVYYIQVYSVYELIVYERSSARLRLVDYLLIDNLGLLSNC